MKHKQRWWVVVDDEGNVYLFREKPEWDVEEDPHFPDILHARPGHDVFLMSHRAEALLGPQTPDTAFWATVTVEW